MSNPELDRQVEEFAEQLASRSNNKEIHKLARTAAESEILLRQIAQLKAVMIGRSDLEMDSEDGETQAVLNSLSDLDRLRRYEIRAAGRRDKAIRKLIRMTGLSRRDKLQ